MRRGFTLIEVLIVMLVSGIILYAAGVSLVQFSRQSKQLSEKVSKDVDMGKAAQLFTSVVESSGVGMEYSHLPTKVSTGCATTEPCVRKLDAGSGKFINISDPNQISASPPAAIEFFRDHDAGNYGTTIPSRDALTPDNPLKLVGTVPYTPVTNISSLDIYATWPLLDETSPPITFLRGMNSDDYFMLNGRYLVSNPPPGGKVFFFGSRSGIDLTKIIGQIVLVYNASAPQQHMFQIVSAAIDCSVGGSPNALCLAEANLYLPNPEWSYGATVDTAELSTNYMITLVPISSATTDRFRRKYMPANFGGSMPSFWQNQDPAQYMLASNVFTLNDPTKANYFTPYPNDIRKIADYLFDEAGINPKISMIPVIATAYFLKKDASTGKLSLMTSSFNNNSNVLLGTTLGDPEFKVIEEVTDQVVFARKLGTTDVKMFIYK
ncbi:MAG: type II secretion system protein [Bacteriovoracia bacterium]